MTNYSSNKELKNLTDLDNTVKMQVIMEDMKEGREKNLAMCEYFNLLLLEMLGYHT